MVYFTLAGKDELAELEEEAELAAEWEDEETALEFAEDAEAAPEVVTDEGVL
jgi:hypothetical protein